MGNHLSHEEGGALKSAGVHRKRRGVCVLRHLIEPIYTGLFTPSAQWLRWLWGISRIIIFYCFRMVGDYDDDIVTSSSFFVKKSFKQLVVMRDVGMQVPQAQESWGSVGTVTPEMEPKNKISGTVAVLLLVIPTHVPRHVILVVLFPSFPTPVGSKRNHDEQPTHNASFTSTSFSG